MSRMHRKMSAICCGGCNAARFAVRFIWLAPHRPSTYGMINIFNLARFTEIPIAIAETGIMPLRFGMAWLMVRNHVDCTISVPHPIFSPPGPF